MIAVLANILMKKLRIDRSMFLLCMALAFCVFTWGLQYKLSLYDPPQSISHQIPNAKLLANDEQSRTAEIVRCIVQEPNSGINLPGHVTLLFILLCVTLLNLSAFARSEQPTDRSWHLNSAILNTFFVRPPPVLL